jgi:hypothetical protein
MALKKPVLTIAPPPPTDVSERDAERASAHLSVRPRATNAVHRVFVEALEPDVAVRAEGDLEDGVH